MDIFTVTVVIMIMIFATVFVSVRCFSHVESTDRKSRLAPFLMAFSILVVLADAFAGSTVAMRLPSDLIFSLSPLLIITSSLWDGEEVLRAVLCMASVQTAFLLYYISVSVGLLPLLPGEWFVRLSGVGAVFIAILFLFAVYMRVREVRLVIKHGNVWSSLCAMVDMVYVMFIIIYAFLLMIGASFGDEAGIALSYAVAPMLALEFAAVGARIANESVFVILSRHERRIVESMKISQVEASSDSSKVEGMYKNIYERVVRLFENDKMYLNNDLTINDIVKVVYTNKLYISRAISQFTGRNFCQFVNYYRVTHSIKLFRENPDLKVAELANRSGFNSTVSFSMAFRLYMSENPSDWCRKERYKAARKKK